MVEYNEDDLAREMEELKQARDVKDGTGQEGAASGQPGPRRRAPPRRKTGSSNLTAFKGAAEGGGEGEGED